MSKCETPRATIAYPREDFPNAESRTSAAIPRDSVTVDGDIIKVRSRTWTATEDLLIMSMTIAESVRRLGRSACSIRTRKWRIAQRGKR